MPRKTFSEVHPSDCGAYNPLAKLFSAEAPPMLFLFPK